MISTTPEMSDGIYYDVPMNDYLPLPYMSSSGVADMQVSIGNFWANNINPKRETKKTDATSFGTVFHTLVLEPEKFPEEYVIKPPNMNFATKDGKAWKKARTEEGKNIVTSDSVSLALDMKDSITKSTLGNLFKNGKSEVTVIWTEKDRDGNSIKCKSRIDRLTENFAIDIKTFGNPLGKPTDKAVCHAIANYRYFMKSWFQDRGLRSAGLDRSIVYLFVDNTGAPNVIAKKLGAQGFNTQNDYWFLAENAAMYAIQKFAECSTRFGQEKWIEEQKIEDFGDEDLPQYILNEVA